jgi:hypothetical protein
MMHLKASSTATWSSTTWIVMVWNHVLLIKKLEDSLLKNVDIIRHLHHFESVIYSIVLYCVYVHYYSVISLSRQDELLVSPYVRLLADFLEEVSQEDVL